MKVVFGLFLLLGVCFGARRFDGHSVFRLDPNPEQMQLILQTLTNMDREEVSFWSHSDLHVTPAFREKIISFLDQHNIRYSVMVENVQELVDQQQAHTAAVREAELTGAPRVGGQNGDPFFDDYRNNTEIANWLASLQQQYPDLVTVSQYNSSYEGRPLRVVRVTSPVGVPGTKPIILWEGGIHAREWIAHATMCYMISNLVTMYGSDDAVTTLLDNLEFHIIPVVNPDGYEYTWTKDRMWRKTRSPNAGSPCIGTDPNRNWDNHWCELGASSVPCSDSYCGPKAFSEVEVRSIADYVLARQKAGQKVLEFIDYHSYGQLYMSPYGYTAQPPKDAAVQTTLGEGAVAAIKSVAGTVFEFGSIYTIIYPASGSSADWGYDNAGITYTYGIELQDTGRYGFMLPASYIRPQGDEIWASLLYTGQYFLGQL